MVGSGADGATYAHGSQAPDFDALVKHGMISPEDLDLFQYADDPESAFTILRDGLVRYHITPESQETPAIAKSRDPQTPEGSL